MAEPKARHPEVVRIGALLETLIHTRRVKVVHLERKLNLSNGTLRRILAGRIELKYQHVIELLEALGISFTDFFRIAYDHGATEPLHDLSAELLRQASKLSTTLVEPRPSLSHEDLGQVVEDALRKLLPEHLLKSATTREAKPPARRSKRTSRA